MWKTLREVWIEFRCSALVYSYVNRGLLDHFYAEAVLRGYGFGGKLK